MPVHPDNLAYVVYTSGSTGRPEECAAHSSQRVRLLRASQEHFQFGAQDVWTLFHSYAFDFSVWEIFGALCYGGRLVIVPYAVSRISRRVRATPETRAGDGAEPDAFGVPASLCRRRSCTRSHCRCGMWFSAARR